MPTTTTPAPLNPTCHVEHMRQWIATLRTTELFQVSGYLHTPHGYCCLGLVGELMIADAPQAYVWRPPTGDIRDDNGDLGGLLSALRFAPTDDRGSSLYQLGDSMQQWLGITESDPALYVVDAVLEDRDGELYGNTLSDDGDNDVTTALTAGFLNDAGLPFRVIADLLEQRFFPTSRA